MKTREFIHTVKENKFLVRINPDLACRGGELGKGCTYYVWQLDIEGKVIPDLRCGQGRFSQAALKKVIKSFNTQQVGAA